MSLVWYYLKNKNIECTVPCSSFIFWGAANCNAGPVAIFVRLDNVAGDSSEKVTVLNSSVSCQLPSM